MVRMHGAESLTIIFDDKCSTKSPSNFVQLFSHASCRDEYKLCEPMWGTKKAKSSSGGKDPAVDDTKHASRDAESAEVEPAFGESMGSGRWPCQPMTLKRDTVYFYSSFSSGPSDWGFRARVTGSMRSPPLQVSCLFLEILFSPFLMPLVGSIHFYFLCFVICAGFASFYELTYMSLRPVLE